MGIYGYFAKFLKENLPAIKPHEQVCQEINNTMDYLCIDSNGLIYGAMLQVQQKNWATIIAAVIRRLEEIINSINPQIGVYIAFDGIAPFAKAAQQKTRRYTRWFESKLEEKQYEQIEYEIGGTNFLKCTFDIECDIRNTVDSEDESKISSLQFTAGTSFMQRLSDSVTDEMKRISKTKGIEIIVSGADIKGEGEHKLLDHIRGISEHRRNIAIFGGDNDLTMLSLSQIHRHNIYNYRHFDEKDDWKLETFKQNYINNKDIIRDADRNTYVMIRNDSHKIIDGQSGKFRKYTKLYIYTGWREELITAHGYYVIDYNMVRWTMLYNMGAMNDTDIIYLNMLAWRDAIDRDKYIVYRKDFVNDIKRYNNIFRYCVDVRLDNIIKDYIFFTLMLGNDFLPHFPALQIRLDGHNKLKNAYIDCMLTQKLNLIDGRSFNKENLSIFIRFLLRHNAVGVPYDSEQETLVIFDAANSKNQNQEENLVNSGSNYTYKGKKGQHAIRLSQFDCTPHTTKSDNEKEGVVGVAISSQEYYKNLFGENVTIKNICNKYLSGLEWCYKYYTVGCPDWKWEYEHHYPPLLTNLVNNIIDYESDIIDNRVDDITQGEFLNKIFPQIYGRNSRTTMRFEWAYCKQMFEAHIYFDEYDDEYEA